MTFYSQIADTTFKKFVGDDSPHLLLSNDGAVSLIFSLDGVTTKGIVQAGETLEFRDASINTVYIKSESGTCSFRIWFYGIQTVNDSERSDFTQVPVQKQFIETSLF